MLKESLPALLSQILVVDWSSQVPLRCAPQYQRLLPNVPFYCTGAFDQRFCINDVLRLIEVPPDVAKRYAPEGAISDAHAFNIAVTQARGKIVLHIGKDTIVRSSFFRWEPCERCAGALASREVGASAEPFDGSCVCARCRWLHWQKKSNWPDMGAVWWAARNSSLRTAQVPLLQRDMAFLTTERKSCPLWSEPFVPRPPFDINSSQALNACRDGDGGA